jgi:hypothetical protein
MAAFAYLASERIAYAQEPLEMQQSFEMPN